MFRAAGVLAGSTAVAVTARSSWAQDNADATPPERDVMIDKRPVYHPDGTKFGVYDPFGDFRDDTHVVTEHVFLSWIDVDLSVLSAADDYASARGRALLFTVEPWSWDLNWNVTSDTLRRRILSGTYDANMKAVAEAMVGFKSPVTIRWGHEMDNPYGRFTWSLWPAKSYINAFRRMHGIIKGILPDATVMWSPRGEKGLGAYYPGDKYVDNIGLSVFGYEPFDKIQYGKPRSFAESLKQGYDLTSGYGKPIWVAELGYEGSREYLTAWSEDATRKFPEFPALEEVVYFNDEEKWHWPNGLGKPNWRVVRDAPTYMQKPSRS
jgi:endoglucanase